MKFVLSFFLRFSERASKGVDLTRHKLRYCMALLDAFWSGRGALALVYNIQNDTGLKMIYFYMSSKLFATMTLLFDWLQRLTAIHLTAIHMVQFWETVPSSCTTSLIKHRIFPRVIMAGG